MAITSGCRPEKTSSILVAGATTKVKEDTINKIDDIGFYTMSEERISQISIDSPMLRTELIVTDACNFKCG